MAKRRKIGEIEEDVIITGGLVAGLYFFIAKPLMNQLGDSPEDKQEVANLDNGDPADNPFSLQFQPYQDYLQSTWGTTDPQQDFTLWQGMKANYDSGVYDNSPLNGSGNIVDVAVGAEMINSAFGFWKWSQNINDVITVFNTIGDQLSVTLMDAYLLANYNIDLLTLIKNGSTARIPIFQARNGLNDTQLAAIIRHINNLPVSH